MSRPTQKGTRASGLTSGGGAGDPLDDLSRAKAWSNFDFKEITLATMCRVAWLGMDQGRKQRIH